MADNTEKPKGSEKAVTTASIQLDEKANDELRLAQADYTGNSHFDLVDIKIVKDGDFYTKGQEDKVHPSLAAILKKKGLIDSYEGEPKK